MTYRITTKRAANGYDYEVRANGKLVASGWTAGTRREAEKEAQKHADDLAQRAADRVGAP